MKIYIYILLKIYCGSAKAHGNLSSFLVRTYRKTDFYVMAVITPRHNKSCLAEFACQDQHEHFCRLVNVYPVQKLSNNKKDRVREVTYKF